MKAIYVMGQRAGLMRVPSNATAEYAEIETVAGVCLVGKKNSGEIQGLCTGTVVSFRESIVLVTSERIILSKEDLAKVKENSKEWNKGEYVLCFKPRKPKNELKIYKLDDVTDVTKPNEGVNFDEGLVMIHLDSKKLSDRFKKHRPFKASDKKITDPKPFNDSICQIVNGNSNRFVVESYEIMYDNGKEVLRARSTPGASTFDTLSKLTAGGAVSDRLAFGGGIFKNDAFVGVLIFDDDDLGQIVAVQCWLGKLVGKYCGMFSRGSS